MKKYKLKMHINNKNENEKLIISDLSITNGSSILQNKNIKKLIFYKIQLQNEEMPQAIFFSKIFPEILKKRKEKESKFRLKLINALFNICNKIQHLKKFKVAKVYMIMCIHL